MNRDPIVLGIFLVLAVLLILHLTKFAVLSVSWPALAIILIVLLIVYLR